MAKHKIVSMPGDGIGNQVLPEAIRVLDAVGFEADYVHADIGWECWIKEGNALPERTIDLLRQHKVGLFGAITSKPKKEAEAELSPALRGKGHQYFSPIVSMRQIFNLDVCMRPCLSFPGNPLNFIRKKPAGGFEEPKVDVVVFRQNTEGLYAGVEWTNPAAASARRPAHPPEVQAVRQGRRRGPGDFGAHHHASGGAAHLRSRIPFTPAQHGYKSVTICEKPNVLRETSGMMEEVAKEVQKQYSDIALWSTNIDAQTMWLTKNPEEYGVIVASNLFGDVISDAFAGTGRRPGFCGVRQHRPGGRGVRADARLCSEVCRVESGDRQSDCHDSFGGDDARSPRRERQGAQDSRRHRGGGGRRQSAHLRHDAHLRRSEVAGPGRGVDDRDDGRHPREAWDWRRGGPIGFLKPSQHLVGIDLDLR